MLYGYSLSAIPTVKQYYTVTRNTVWQITDADHILIYIMEGKCDVETDGESMRLEAGDVCLIPAGHSYLRRSVGGEMCTMTYVHFSTEAVPVAYDASELAALLSERKLALDRGILDGETEIAYPTELYLENHVKGADREKVLPLLQGINLFSANRPLMCHLQSALSFSQLLVLLSNITIDKLLSDASLVNAPILPPKLKRAIGYIMRHTGDRVTLDDLARLTSVSKQQLIRYFKTAFGIPPIRYILEYKLTRAKELLFNYPELTVKEIAFELGFDNPHYFTRAFSKIMGESPTAYRNRTVGFVEQ